MEDMLMELVRRITESVEIGLAVAIIVLAYYGLIEIFVMTLPRAFAR